MLHFELLELIARKDDQSLRLVMRENGLGVFFPEIKADEMGETLEELRFDSR